MSADKTKEPKVVPPAGYQNAGKMSQRALAVVALAIVLLLIVLLILVATLGPKPAVTCKIVNQDLAQASPQIRWDQYPYLVEDQVIVIGPKNEARDIAKSLNLEPIQECSLNYLAKTSRRGDEQVPGYVFTAAERRNLATNLYAIPAGEDLDKVVRTINDEGRNLHVFADYNLLLGLPLSVCGSPSYVPIGSPYGTPELLPVGEAQAVKLFWDQWALQQIGAGPLLKNTLAGAYIKHTGDGTLVGVFDTSPFPDPWDNSANNQVTGQIKNSELVKWVYPTMDMEPLALQVSYPKWEAIQVPSQKPASDIRDHGLFVAGLVHAVAPSSEIHLIRVLNEYGCGDLFTLKIALDSFIGEVEAGRGPEADEMPLEGVVINLSLGIAALNPEGNSSLSECSDGTSPNEIVSLCSVLREAYDKGAVIVAAAGNDHGATHIPAVYSFVIGVQANNSDRKKAVFSNDGNVSAPGGESDLKCACYKESAQAPDSAAADSQTPQCQGDCAQAIIGPVLFPPKGHAYWPTHYGYWTGTSFSTPLVSGQAALLFEAGFTQNETYQRIKGIGLPPDWDLVINIPNSLK